LGRILAIDYGQKRVGFAVTDEMRICANALETVHVSEAYQFLINYLQQENVESIVIGEPKTLQNTPSASARFIEPFVKRLQKSLPDDIKIVRVDERFTSKMALQTMIDAGLSKKQRADKETVDKISATIILQSYLLQQDIALSRSQTN